MSPRALHQGAMGWVDALLRREDGAAVCAATLRDDNPFVVEGSAPASIAMELIAQAAARSLQDGSAGPRGGRLLAARALHLHADVLRIGEPMEVWTWTSVSVDLATVRGELRAAGRCLASASLTIGLAPP